LTRRVGSSGLGRRIHGRNRTRSRASRGRRRRYSCLSARMGSIRIAR
jgi:hypothetical protein